MTAFTRSLLALLIINSVGSQLLSASSVEPSHPPQSEQSTPLDDRQRFLAAEKALMVGDLKTFNTLKSSLSNYPLLVYLDYAQLKRKLNRVEVTAIDEFFLKHENTPLAKKLRIHWLLHLIKSDNSALFLRYYQPSLSTNLTCQYLHYELENSTPPQRLMETFEPLWQTHRSLPSSCDPSIKAFLDAGLLTKDLIWKRMSLALRHGRPRLAQYLAKKLPQSDQHAAKRFFSLRQRPERIEREIKQTPAHERDGEIYSYAVQRLVYRDLDKALKLWPKVQDLRKLSVSEKQYVNNAFAYALTRDAHPAAIPWFTALPPVFSSDDISGWKVRYALKTQSWELADRWLEEARNQGSSLSEEGIDYWQARAKQQLGHHDLAREQLAQVAKSRSYYGFLASAILGRPPTFDHRPTRVEEEDLAHVLEQPGVLRARELFFLGRLSDARREWLYSKTELSDRQKQAAAIAASAWGWHDRAIFALASVKTYNDVDIRFPLAYADELKRATRRLAMDPAWVYAITRQESAFMPDASSPVGATGLMQLMPYTAKFVARQMGKRYRGKYELLKPALNLDYGTYYLNYLTEKYSGNRVYATAAYNAGPSRVNAWLAEPMPAIDIWIENIPFSETRRYVKSVLAYQVIYGAKLPDAASIITNTIAPELLVAKDSGLALLENESEN